MTDKSEPGRPTDSRERENLAAGDATMQDDLTEERQVTPQQKEDVAEDLSMDP